MGKGPTKKKTESVVTDIYFPPNTVNSSLCDVSKLITLKVDSSPLTQYINLDKPKPCYLLGCNLKKNIYDV